MTNVTPIQQSPADALRQALEIAETWTPTISHHDPEMSWRRIQYEFEDIARLIRHALEQLGNPNVEAIRAADVMLRSYDRNTADAASRRAAYDAAAAILNAQLTGTL